MRDLYVRKFGRGKKYYSRHTHIDMARAAWQFGELSVSFYPMFGGERKEKESEKKFSARQLT